MKKAITALVIAGGLSAAAVTSASAAPAGSPGLGTLNVQGLITPAQYYGGYGYGGGYGYRPSCYYVRRCSGYYPYQRCWRERVCH